jgi:hypothetical protein
MGFDLYCWAFYIDGNKVPLYVVAPTINEAVDSVTEWCISIDKIEELGEGYYVMLAEEIEDLKKSRHRIVVTAVVDGEKKEVLYEVSAVIPHTIMVNRSKSTPDGTDGVLIEIK